MSQDTFPMVDGEESAPFTDEAEHNRKAVFVAGGVAAAVVLAAGGWFLLGGGGGETPSAAAVVHRPASVVATAKVPAQTVKKLPAPYAAQVGRDPFKALYVLPVSAPAGSTTTSTSVPTGSGTTSTSARTPPAGGGATTAPPVGTTRYSLKLVSISKPSPEVRFTTWQVGVDKKTVIPGQRFGKFGEIVVLAFGKNASGAVDKAIIQVGDDSPLDVAVGESVSIL